MSTEQIPEEGFPGVEPITHSNVILVEGDDDYSIFNAVISNLDLDNTEIRSYGGKDNLGNALQGLKIASGFSVVEHLVIVRDADQSAMSSLQSVRGYLSAMGLPAPASPMTFAGAKPEVAIVLLPPGEDSGELEDLLLKSVEDPEALDCVDTYLNCIHAAAGINAPKVAKSRIHAYLASREKPGLRFGAALQAGYLKINSPALNPLETLLSELSETV